MNELISTGSRVFVRTVTLYYLGEVVRVTSGAIELRKASWVADTGRLVDFLTRGASVAREIETYPGEGICYVSLGAVIDISPWLHELPELPELPVAAEG